MTHEQIAWAFGFLSGVWTAVPFALFVAFVIVPVAVDVWAVMHRAGRRHAGHRGHDRGQ